MLGAPLLTSDQMRAAEQAAIGSGAVSGAQLMERAGQGTVEAILRHWPALARNPGQALVLCGPGNNGGDGYVIARLLRDRGWSVTVRAFGDPARLPPDARAARIAWLELGTAQSAEAPPDLIVDAILGIGLTRDLDESLAAEIAAIHALKDRDGMRPRVVAVDVPSGLCADSGRNRGNRGCYDLTVTFHSAKPGHYLADGPELCGALRVVDIGLPQTNGPQDVLCLTASPTDMAKRGGGHKFGHGHALVLSGGVGRGGAARMAARGALRIGAGLVTLGCPPAAVIENAAQLNAVMLARIADGDALARLLDEDERIAALALGPALGTDGRALSLVLAALKSGRRTVLDADALTLLARHPEARARLHQGCVLTPHGGEFARLFPDLAERLSADPGRGAAVSKPEIIRAAANRVGCTVLFKGADTVIAAPDGQVALNAASHERAAPWLATAGAGDVLAGFIAGLLARGRAPFKAACDGAWLHVESARAFGPGLIAEDLPEALPGVLRHL